MLHRAADPAGNVNLRANRLASLANLMGIRDPTRIDSGSAGSYRSS